MHKNAASRLQINIFLKLLEILSHFHLYYENFK